MRIAASQKGVEVEWNKNCLPMCTLALSSLLAFAFASTLLYILAIRLIDIIHINGMVCALLFVKYLRGPYLFIFMITMLKFCDYVYYVNALFVIMLSTKEILMILASKMARPIYLYLLVLFLFGLVGFRFVFF